MTAEDTHNLCSMAQGDSIATYVGACYTTKITQPMPEESC